MPTIIDHAAAAEQLAAAVIRRAEAAGYAISAEIRRAAVAAARKLIAAKPHPGVFLAEFLYEFRQILHRYEPILARALGDGQLAAWLQGGQSVLHLLPEAPAAEPWQLGEAPPELAIVRFPIIEAAAADLASRRILTPDEFYSQTEAAQARAFTVSRVASLDALETVRDALAEAVVDGDTVQTFKTKIAAAIDGSGIGEGKQELIFRNAMMTSYARGQKAVVQHPLVRNAAVFAWRSEIDDSRLTQLCRCLSRSGIDGTAIYCVDDPVWAKVAPQSHHGCRCSTCFISVARAAAKGLRVAQQWLRSGVRPPDAELFVPEPDLSEIPAAELQAFASWVSPWMS